MLLQYKQDTTNKPPTHTHTHLWQVVYNYWYICLLAVCVAYKYVYVCLGTSRMKYICGWRYNLTFLTHEYDTRSSVTVEMLFVFWLFRWSHLLFAFYSVSRYLLSILFACPPSDSLPVKYSVIFVTIVHFSGSFYSHSLLISLIVTYFISLFTSPIFVNLFRFLLFCFLLPCFSPFIYFIYLYCSCFLSFLHSISFLYFLLSNLIWSFSSHLPFLSVIFLPWLFLVYYQIPLFSLPFLFSHLLFPLPLLLIV